MKCPQLSFDKQHCNLDYNLDTLIHAWEIEKNKHTAEYDNFLSKKAENMANKFCDDNIILLRSIFQNVKNTKSIAKKIKDLETAIKRD